tara:strand:+ start:41873 stop:43126 length:1254 start_codon:yes stop_codon:yes gene_type:complete
VNLKTKIIIDNLLQNILFVTFILLLIFGRNFTGVGILDFRIGEILVLFQVILFHFYSIKNKDRSLQKILILFLLIFYLKLFYVIFEIENFNFFRFSSTFWAMSIYVLAKESKLSNEKITASLVGSLSILYVLNFLYYPDFILDFFNTYSDKFDFTKASDLFAIYALTIYFSYRFTKFRTFLLIFVIFTSLYLPKFFFLSTGSTYSILFAFLVFSISVVYKKIKINNKILYLLIIFSILLVVFTLFNLSKTSIEITDITNTNLTITSMEKKIIPDKLFYLDDNLIRSSDTDIDWRLMIWQTTISDSYSNNQIIFGMPINEIVPIMEHPYYKTINLNNVNLHNYFIQTFAYFGLFGVLLASTFIFLIIRQIFIRENNLNILVLIVPILFISSFDSSMETVRFPFIIFAGLGYLSRTSDV